MATNRRKPSKPQSGGSTLFGVLAGLILGLAVAAGVAFFVTQVPMPFVDKASRDPAKTLLPDVRDAPDPNRGLYGKDHGAGAAPSGPTATAPLGVPGMPQVQGTSPSMSDDIGALLATLGAPEPAQAARSSSVATTTKPAAPNGRSTAQPPAATDAKPAAATTSKPAGTQTTYYLQAGAFRSEKDAEGVKAQILLMGLPVQVQKAQANGSTINRVRVGPFKGIDEMNRARVRLGEAKIDSSVVRP